jgi:hypothetical protein
MVGREGVLQGAKGLRGEQGVGVYPKVSSTRRWDGGWGMGEVGALVKGVLLV